MEFVKSMKLKSTIALIVLLLPITLWVFSQENRLQNATQAPPQNDDFFAKLSIEPVTKTLAPNFLLTDLNGNAIRLHDFRGKVVLLNFWATWCPSCRFEMPSMEALHAEMSSQGLAILAVAIREDEEEVRAFYQEHGLSFPALLDQNAEAFDLYESWSLPTTFLINKGGYIVGKVVGYRDWHSDASKAFFRQLLEESA